MLMPSIKSPFYSSEVCLLFASARKWKEVKLTVVSMHSDFTCRSQSCFMRLICWFRMIIVCY